MSKPSAETQAVGLPTRMVMGALGGMGAASVCHPLDTFRVQLQLDSEGGSKRVYNGTIDVAKKLFRNEGSSNCKDMKSEEPRASALRYMEAYFAKLKHGLVRGWYPGITAAYLRQWTYGSCRLGIYSFLLDKKRREGGEITFASKLGMGLISGGIGSLVGTPSELALVRMTADSRLPIEQRRNYKNVFECLFRVARDDGAAAMFTDCGTLSHQLSKSLRYSEAKIALSNWNKTVFPLESVQTMFVGTVFASLIANTIINPVDVLKSRLQNMPKPKPGAAPMYTGVVDCAMQLLAKEGAMAFYKGFVPAFIKLAPYTTISLIITEKISQLVVGRAAM